MLLLLWMACAVPDDGALPEGFGAWTLRWSDEFDGPAGAAIDGDTWTHELGGDGWGNQQLEFNTDSTENVRLDGEGRLEIVAREEQHQGNAYTSGRVRSLGGFQVQFGRMEARIRLPAGRGLWPAFWMLGADFEDVGWPACGEIDIMELRGEEPYVAHGTVHGPGYSGGEGISGSYTLAEGDFSDEYHDFAVDWDPGHLVWFIDGEPYHRVTRADLPEGAPWVFDGEFFFILNLAVGGTFLDEPDETTPFPAVMSVEHVRVYERTE